MKIKKSKFAKLLSLALPIAAISVVAPVVLTSCGTTSSTDTPSDGGGSSGGGSTDKPSTPTNPETPSTYAAVWDETKLGSLTGVTVDSSKNPVITLTSSKFNDTEITKNSKFADIKTSLTPTTTSEVTKSAEVKDGEESGNTTPTSKTMYSVLSTAITNIDKYNVTLKLDPNTISFDYTNDEDVGNSVVGQFTLTPKDSKTGTETVLSFTLNNFDDSYNGDVSDQNKQLKWNVDAIAKAFKSDAATGNKLPDVTPSNNGASAVITLSDSVGLGQVMDELCSSKGTITGDELKGFITGDTEDYKVENAKISSWAPNIDNTMVFTRIVIPSTTTDKENAVMYIAYNGFKSDIGNGAWNRNIPYFGEDASKDLWDLKWGDPVLDLSKTGTITLDDGKTISTSSTADQIISEATAIREYMAKNYIINYEGNFKISDSVNNNQKGKFDANGQFQEIKSAKSVSKQNASITLKDTENGNNQEASNDSNLKDNNNVVFIQFVIQTETGKTTTAAQNNYVNGIYKGFYIIGYTA